MGALSRLVFSICLSSFLSLVISISLSRMVVSLPDISFFSSTLSFSFILISALSLACSLFIQSMLPLCPSRAVWALPNFFFRIPSSPRTLGHWNGWNYWMGIYLYKCFPLHLEFIFILGFHL